MTVSTLENLAVVHSENAYHVPLDVGAKIWRD